MSGGVQGIWGGLPQDSVNSSLKVCGKTDVLAFFLRKQMDTIDNIPIQ